MLNVFFVVPGYAGANPGYGFHSDYTHGQQYQNQNQYPRGQAAPGTGNGFWTGMGTGGVLGYLFGRQRSVERSLEKRLDVAE